MKSQHVARAPIALVALFVVALFIGGCTIEISGTELPVIQ